VPKHRIKLSLQALMQVLHESRTHKQFDALAAWVVINLPVMYGSAAPVKDFTQVNLEQYYFLKFDRSQPGTARGGVWGWHFNASEVVYCLPHYFCDLLYGLRFQCV
jgi:hypothetical protein